MTRQPRPTALLAVFTLAVAAPRASAWGPNGHRAVGRVAERQLAPGTARAVAELLAPEQLAYVGTWADEVRSEEQWAKAESWHWVTIPDGQTYATAEKNPAGDVLEAIGRFERILADRTRPRAERVEALKWLTHFVGDLHQPLHVGTGSDRGGNDTLVLWFGQPSNLHSVWDSGMLDQVGLSFSELAELVDHTTSAEVHEWQASTPLDWAIESQALRPGVYKIGDRRLSYRYLHDNWPTVQRRLAQAGVRLAGLLNRLVGGAR